MLWLSNIKLAPFLLKVGRLFKVILEHFRAVFLCNDWAIFCVAFFWMNIELQKGWDFTKLGRKAYIIIEEENGRKVVCELVSTLDKEFAPKLVYSTKIIILDPFLPQRVSLVLASFIDLYRL